MRTRKIHERSKMPSVSLTASDLEKKFLNKIIFKSVSFTLLTGSSLAVTGRNGSGKSTLLKVIAGLLKPNKGSVKVKYGQEYVDSDRKLQYIGMMSPYLNLYDELTARENLEFFSALKCTEMSRKQISENTDSLLQKVGLYGRRNDQVKNYSSGMKQRLKISFAVLNEPGILLLDEPRTNLDREGIEIIYKISEEQKIRGILIIATNEAEDTKMCSECLNIEDFK